MASTKQQVLQLYRELLRVARAFPERSMGAKLQYNTRELIRLRRDETSATKIAQFLQEGRDTLRMYQLLQEEPSVLTAITRKNEQKAAEKEREREFVRRATQFHQQPASQHTQRAE
uniref:Complex 1 LYR protein domain-containing protein n=1 Tax=Globisporangium ultimum (strain ATCC 200006 / CBS 805.95 / DAOM BR144) TaxID=431595 RepID=K3W6F4_GLOUD